MLPSFPGLEDDELLYSAVARYHREAAWAGWSVTLEVLFGRRHVVASHELPGHVGALAARLRPGDGRALDLLVEGATLLPYLAASADPARRAEARRAVEEGGGSSYFALGLAAGVVPRLRRLRFCPACRDEAVGRLGFAWWRRRHQLPGSLVCVRHRIPLLESPIDLAQLPRHRFLLANALSCPSGATRLVDGDPVAVERLLAIADGEMRVLEAGALPLDPAEMRRRLDATGLLRPGGRVDQDALLRRAAAFWAPAARWLPHVLSEAALAAWLPSLVRGPRGRRHPLLHVALSAFLDRQPSALANRPGPFGPGPWPCRNPLPVHAVESASVALTTSRSKGAVSGRFSCSCGYAYSRSLSAEGVVGAPRFLAFGPALEPDLRRLVDAGTSLRAAARLLCVDPSTVVLEARRLGITIRWGNARRPAMRRRGRTRPPASAPVPRSRPAAGCRDWAELDAAMLARFRRATASLLSARPPARITLSAMERTAGLRPGWLRPRGARLPLTVSLVTNAVETTAAFKERRALFVISRLEGPVTIWRVMRVAGLTCGDRAMVEELLASSGTQFAAAAT